MTVTGSGFTGATAVDFGPTPATTFTVISDTQITATAPAQSAGSRNIFVVTAGGTSTGVAADLFTYKPPPPVVTAISPTSGSTTGGTTVTVTGSGFTGATAVDFGPTPATTFTVISDTQITATAPAQSAGSRNIFVVTAGGTSTGVAADLFTYKPPPPVVTAISPTSGSTTGGTTVTVTGSGFTGATAVDFGPTPATTFTVISDTQITATAPAQSAGSRNIFVVTAGGTSSGVAADLFTYH